MALEKLSFIPNTLSIAGLDPSGGAGILADTKVFSALETYACGIVTALTAQNTQTVNAIHVPDIDFFKAQVQTLLSDVTIHALKLGMLANKAVIEAWLALTPQLSPDTWVVCDPVMISKSGHALLEPEAVSLLKEQVIPQCDLITPNLPEAALLMGIEEAHLHHEKNRHELTNQLHQTLKLSPNQWVLLKGGHGHQTDLVTDYLSNGQNHVEFVSPRIHTNNTHGTGCSYSAAITALLAHHQIQYGKTISVDQWFTLVNTAHQYIHQAIIQSSELSVGHGHGPLHHFHAWWAKGGHSI
jgi:hydroxymethylpyrimidine/phosphomethylpyrimidine kinase